ncbi:MAG: tetratricopeptide repeat protein [Treponema sp.]|nr:tetratricopeptide repeat protein [Treponema sp.]
MEKNLILTKAKGAVLSHDFTTAARLYKMLLTTDPSNVDYLKQLGSIYVQNQEDEKAIPYYEQIITFYPHYIEAMNSLGAIYRRLHRYEESIAILQKAVDEGRDVASVNYNLGFTYKEMGNYQDAIEAFNLVIHENPDDVLAYNHLGKIYDAQKNYEKAIASYKRGLQIDQNHPILNYNLAHCYEETKNITDAIRCYQAALKTRPGWVDAINDFSELLIKCQKNKEAQDLVQQSIKLHPGNADLLCLLGRVYLNQYDYAAAEKTFKQAESLKRNDVKILLGLSKALESGDKVDAALEKVLAAMELEPENRDIRKQYVHSLLTAKDYEAALTNVRELYEEDGGKDTGVLDLYGQYYICKDQEEEAQKYYEKIRRQNHHYKDYMLGAASRFNQIGKFEKAEKYANDYVERRPQNPEGYNMLGQIFESQGDLEKAKDSYSRSRAIRVPNALADKKIEQFKNELAKRAEPVPEVVEEKPAPLVENEKVEEQTSQAPAEEEKEEEFDYSMMGGNVPLQEGLLEEEGDFFDALDEEEEEEREQEKEDSAQVFGDDDIFDDDASKDQNDSLENGLRNGDPAGASSAADDYTDDYAKDYAESEPGSGDLSQSAADDFDQAGLNQPDTSLSDSNSADRGQPYQNQQVPDQPYQNQPYQNQPYQNPMMDSRMQQMAMDNAAYAMEAAFAAQKMAQQLAEQQKKMQEENQKSLQEALDKVQALQEEKFREQDKEFESLMDDAESPVEETEPAFEEVETAPEETEPAPVEDVETAAEETETAPAAEAEAEPVAGEEEYVTAGETEAADEIESMAGEGEAPVADEIETAAGEVEPVAEEAETAVFVTTEELLTRDLAEISLGQPEAEAEVDTQPEEGESDDGMLEKIERILSDDSVAEEYKDEIELFKKIKVFSQFIPESEKNSFVSNRMRLVIEYIISRMSGKPGLLNTATALIKSGVLGEEYLSHLQNIEVYSETQLPNSLLYKVLLDMKNLSKFLDDKALVSAMEASLDNILERIELEDRKSQIF